MKKLFFLLFLIMTTQNFISAQLDSIDVNSVEAITDKMLEMISGAVDEPRDWETYRQLFLPTAQKISIRKSKNGKSRVSSMNIEEFVRNVGPLYARDGFEEYKIGLTIHEFNGIATAFQSYYCKNLIGTYEARGVNTYQLVYVDDRWWIASTLFAAESDGVVLPDEYLFDEYKKESKKE